MKTLKKGISGEEVKTLQRALGVNADGIFGVMTEQAVKDFQRSRQLTADGIVGAMTWAALGVTENKCVDPSVVYLPLSVHVTRLPGRSIKYLAIHYTAGSSSDAGRARAVKHVFESRKASADFAVDDKEMVPHHSLNRNPILPHQQPSQPHGIRHSLIGHAPPLMVRDACASPFP